MWVGGILFLAKSHPTSFPLQVSCLSHPMSFSSGLIFLSSLSLGLGSRQWSQMQGPCPLSWLHLQHVHDLEQWFSNASMCDTDPEITGSPPGLSDSFRVWSKNMYLSQAPWWCTRCWHNTNHTWRTTGWRLRIWKWVKEKGLDTYSSPLEGRAGSNVQTPRFSPWLCCKMELDRSCSPFGLQFPHL